MAVVHPGDHRHGTRLQHGDDLRVGSFHSVLVREDEGQVVGAMREVVVVPVVCGLGVQNDPIQIRGHGDCEIISVHVD